MDDYSNAQLSAQHTLLKTQFEEKRIEFIAAYGGGPTAEKFVNKLIRASLTCLSDPTNADVLMKSTTQSIARCVLTFASLAIIPDKHLAHGYFGRFKDEAVPMIGYKGAIHLAKRDESVNDISAHCVYRRRFRDKEGVDQVEGDHFVITLGTEPNVEHIIDPNFERIDTDKALIDGVYGIVFYKNGTKAVEYMSKQQIDAIRRGSKMKDGAPWSRYYGQMARKTVIQRMTNYLDLAPDLRDILARGQEAEFGNDGEIIKPVEDYTVKDRADDLEEKASNYLGEDDGGSDEHGGSAGPVEDGEGGSTEEHEGATVDKLF